MKKLELGNMETIQAGGFWDGVCIAVGAAGIAGALGATIVTGGIAGGVLIAAEIGCLAREIF